MTARQTSSARRSPRSRLWLLGVSVLLFLLTAGYLHLRNSSDFLWLYSLNYINAAAIAVACLPFVIEAGMKKQWGRLALGGGVITVILVLFAMTTPRVTFQQAAQKVADEYGAAYCFSLPTFQPKDWSSRESLQGVYYFVVKAATNSSPDVEPSEIYVTVHPRTGEMQVDDSDYMRQSIATYRADSGDELQLVAQAAAVEQTAS
ncbi:MAG: hypothetical protein ACOX7F_07305 [Eubacteriales bacterium]